ncbi:MAG TPA: efflux RND transporter periplasmic adaptor subunit [Candidatus Baltobacteraceae bacterium]|jgi:HlyD family secretion protein|nr:efflux RND transporter periplasmic adaptor subunit [Candidatus Baltobacteraceae bacterium]
MQYHRWALAGLAAVAIVMGGCAKPSQQHGAPPLDVEAAPAQRHDIATYLSLDGQVAPLEESTLSFQQSGPITAIYVNQGDRVGAGELLAKVDDSTLRAQLGQVLAQIDQASAQAQAAQLNVPITQSQTAQSVQSAKAALANAQLQYNQNQQLFKQGYVSQLQLEQARAAYAAAQAQYQTAISNQGTTGVQSSNAAAARQGVAAAQAQANTLRTEIGQTSLYAPFDGVVTARLMDPGAMAQPGTAVLRVDKIDTVWVNVNVPDEDLAYVHSGTPVSFTSSQLGNRRFSGMVNTVNAVPTQGTLSYQARIRQSNPDGSLRGGMLVTATIEKAHHRDAIVVPRSAVAQGDQGSNVFIVGNGNKAEQVPVTVGIQTDTLSEVSSPRIQPGTLVITTRPDALQNGSTVAVAGRNGAAGQPRGGY